MYTFRHPEFFDAHTQEIEYLSFIQFIRVLMCANMEVRQCDPSLSDKLNRNTSLPLAHTYWDTLTQTFSMSNTWTSQRVKSNTRSCKCDVSQNPLRSALCAGRAEARESSSQPPSLLPLSNELCSIWAFRRVRKVRHCRDTGTRHCCPLRLLLHTPGAWDWHPNFHHHHSFISFHYSAHHLWREKWLL